MIYTRQLLVVCKQLRLTKRNLTAARYRVDSTERTRQGRSAVGELDQCHVHVQFLADANVPDTIVHVPVYGPGWQQWRRVGQDPQAKRGRRHVHGEPSAPGIRLHGPRVRSHRSRRHVVGTHVRHPHRIRG